MGLILIASGSRADRSYLAPIAKVLGEKADLWSWQWRQQPIDAGNLAKAAAEALNATAARLAGGSYDLMLVCGDRWEIASACVAATLAGVPIAHLGAGEVTLGSYDDQFRTAIEGMASLKFPMTQEAMRWATEGQKASSVPAYLAGCTSVERGPIVTGDGTAIVIMHPETRGKLPERMTDTICALVARHDLKPVVIGANPDVGSNAFPGVEHLPDFHARLRSASLIIGNSSAGIIEAPILGTPSVNIGRRQEGRPRAISVIDSDPDSESIDMAIAIALQFSKREIQSPYYRPGAVNIVAEVCSDYIRR